MFVDVTARGFSLSKHHGDSCDIDEPGKVFAEFFP